MLAVAGLYTALPESLSVGPRWLLGAVIGIFIVLLVVSYRRGQHRVNHQLGLLTAAVITAFVVLSLVLLIRGIIAHTEAPPVMLLSATSLWVVNVLNFTLWYWRIDAGGPHGRASRTGYEGAAFQFPQMALSEKSADFPEWSPAFVDYLFQAFNTSTALSPTDSPVLSRPAKVLSMVQSMISLTIIVILAARAVNIL